MDRSRRLYRLRRDLGATAAALGIAGGLAIVGGCPASASASTSALPSAGSASASASVSPWRRVLVPQSLPYADLSSASLLSATSGWGVGTQWVREVGTNSTPGRPAIWRWTASGWSRQRVPLPAGELNVVAADKGHAWASGEDDSQPGPGTGLNLYWNGIRWRRAADRTFLSGIAATGATAWAYGVVDDNGYYIQSILRWTGTNWTVVRQPSTILTSILATGASDVWVGSDDENGHTLILRHSGSTWRRLRPPNVGAADAMAAGSPGNVWVAGDTGVLHFNGAAWTRLPLPWLGPYAAGPIAVDGAGRPWLTAASSFVANRSQYFHLQHGRWIQQLGPVHPLGIGMSTDALTRVPGTCGLMAVGSAKVFNQPIAALSELNEHAWCPPAPAASTLTHPLVTGTGLGGTATRQAQGPGAARWRVTPVPGAVQPVAGLQDVAAAGPHAAWAVGHQLEGGLGVGDPLILRWNGTRWRIDPIAGVNWTGTLTAVAADSPRDAWAIGHEDPLQRGLAHLVHWDGVRWRSVAFPGMASGGTQLSGVAAVSPRLAWIVGSGPGDRPLILHWNGTAVRKVALPLPSGTLNEVRARGAADAWAVGYRTKGTGAVVPLVLHWDGTTWHTMPAPRFRAPFDGASLEDVLPGPGGTAWVVGDQDVGIVPFFYLEHWNGSAWHQVVLQSNIQSSIDGSLTSISGDGQGRPRWVGTLLFGWPAALFLHFDGRSWRKVWGPSVPSVVDGSMRVAHVPGTAVTLAAGTASLFGLDQQVYDVPQIESTAS